jgi:glycosyltransferase involved in cell wall biosynthesis
MTDFNDRSPPRSQTFQRGSGISEGAAFATTPPKVSVVVPHYRDLNRLELCLASLERQTYPRDRFEIIVADNGSPEGETAVAAVVRGRAQLVVVPEKGAGSARNGGVAKAQGDILAFTDCDCIAAPDWLAEGVLALSGGDLVGGRVQVQTEHPDAPRPVEAFEVVFAFNNQRYVERLGFTVTANLICPRTLFDEVGGFRVGLSEDLEWSHRARAAGYRLIFASAAVVSHPARRTWEELVGKWKRINAETFALNVGRPAWKLRWILRSSLLPISAIIHTPKVLTAPGLSSWSQRWGALTVLYRLRIWRLIDAVGLLVAAGRR